MGEDKELDMPPDVPLDRWVELLVSINNRKTLRKVVSEEEYNGSVPKAMLYVYDVIHDLPKGLHYGIKGFELLKRDPKVITELQNPDKLVDYVVATADSLDELVKLQETIIQEGKFNSRSYGSDEFANTKKYLAQSLLKVAFEIAEHQKNVGKDRDSVAKFTKPLEHLEQWKIRLDAHIAIVMAYQATKGISDETLDAIAAYESLADTYEPYSGNWFSYKAMEAYFKRKNAVGTLNKGELPEELKAEPMFRQPFYGPGPDQYFRMKYFGEKEPEWRKEGNEKAKSKQKDGIGELLGIMKDPWEYYKKELEFLGLNKDMTYDEAKITFRRGVLAQRATFIRMDTETLEYKDAMRKTQDFLEAWKKVGMLYQNKPDSQPFPSA